MALFQRKIGPIFLKEDSETTEYIEKLNLLSEKVSSDLKKQIDKEIKLAQYGEMGEKNIAFELKNSGIDMYILHDIYLTYGELSAQIDYMVFTRKRIYVIECKNLIGDITIDNDGNFVRKYELFGKIIKEGIYSPITQNERHMEVIKNIRAAAKGNFISRALFETNYERNYKSLIVLANPKTILNDRNAKKEIKQKVYRADQLIRVIKEMDAEVKDFSYSDKDMKQLAQFFLSASEKNMSDYSRKYEEMIEKCNKDKKEAVNIQEKKVCPRCGADLVVRISKKGNNAGKQFWGCSTFPKCRYIENI